MWRCGARRCAFFVLFYTWPLKYIGLGEIAVLIVWGPLMIGGGYFVWSAVLTGLIGEVFLKLVFKV
jgi:1,4-dihydroxy-2-naphthoate octaprenyltransferase